MFTALFNRATNVYNQAQARHLANPFIVNAKSQAGRIKIKKKFRKHYFKFFFALAAIINGLAVASLPWLPGTTVFIVEADFNEDAFDGTLNGVTVIKMSKLRFGVWTACYSDSNHANTCLSSAFAYQVTITDANNAHAVVAPLWTAMLKVQILAGILTLVAFIYSCVYSSIRDPKKRNGFKFWYAFVAMAFTASVLAVDGILCRNVGNVTQALGEGVKTQLGPGFAWVVLALILIFGGCAGHCWEDFRDQRKKGVEKDLEDKAARAAEKAKWGVVVQNGNGTLLN